MAKTFQFIPCNGVAPEGKEGDQLSIMFFNNARAIYYEGGAWRLSDIVDMEPEDWNPRILFIPPSLPVLTNRKHFDNS